MRRKGQASMAWMVILLMVSWVGPVQSGEDVPILTLRESTDLALRQSVVIHSAGEAVKASESKKKEAFTGFLPRFSTYYSYTRYNEPPQTKSSLTNYSPIQIGTADNYNWAVEMRQPVFAGGGIKAAYDINRIGADVSRLEQEAVIQDIIRDVGVSYFSILKAERILGVAKQSLEQLEAHRNVAQQFYEAGVIPRNDLLQSEVQLANGQQYLVQAENNLELAKSQFNTVLRRDLNTPVRVEDILQYKAYTASLEDCLKAAQDRRPEIKASLSRVEQSRKVVDLDRSEYYPAVNMVGSYGRFGDTADVQGSRYQDQENWSVMARAEWKFWEWGRTRHRVDASTNRERQAQDALAHAKDQVALEVKNAYLFMREAEKRVFVAKKTIEQAEENYRLNEERYKEQVATSTDVLDALTLLTRAKSDYFNALSDYHIALTRLERSMGSLGKDKGQ
jgi:outer membrane protein